MSRLNRLNNDIPEPTREEPDYLLQAEENPEESAPQEVLQESRREKKEKRRKKQKKTEETYKEPEVRQLPDPGYVAEYTEDELERLMADDEEVQAKSDKDYRKRIRIITIVLAVLSVYMLFLIYGVLMTSWQYNDEGHAEAQVLSVQDIRDTKNYNVIKVQYEKCRILYEKILEIDARLAVGNEDPRLLATEYEGLLENVTDLSVKTNALEVAAGYEQIKTMLYEWVYTDAAVYLQEMSKAIAQDNEESAAIAIQYKNKMYEKFSSITSNLIAVGEEIPGVDLTDMKKWSPEGYTREFLEGR